MASKRMFALDVIDTDRFCEMPVSARLLYYELGMRGDDEGFVQNPKRIMLTTGTTVDDLKVLAAKGYVILFDSGVLVITHWQQNNTLKNDRFRSTQCLEEKAQIQTTAQKTYRLLSSGTSLEPERNQIGTEVEPQHNLTKRNKSEKRTRTSSPRRFTPPTIEEVSTYCQERGSNVDAQRFVDFYASKGWKVGNAGMKDWHAAVRNWERRDDMKNGGGKHGGNYDGVACV
ncbi:MAG: hypothetical protein UD963_11205 [Christensenellales bacterium]|nr:hypothetical protein [Christensenellales bacterium]